MCDDQCLADQASALWWEKQQTEQNCTSPPPPHTDEATHHVVDIFQDVSEAADNNGELVLGDVDQTLLVVFCTDFTVGVLLSNFNGKLQEETKTSYQDNIQHSFNTSRFYSPLHAARLSRIKSSPHFLKGLKELKTSADFPSFTCNIIISYFPLNVGWIRTGIKAPKVRKNQSCVDM